MFRKLMFALAATVALSAGAATVNSTPAEAWGWKKHHHHFHGFHGYRFHRHYVGYNGCYVKRVVFTPWGPRARWVNVCY